MAAQLPPRRNGTEKRIPPAQLTPLQTLLQMGFPKHRAEKALAATGSRGVQLAADWLLSHVNDPTLDNCAPREYILYLCPTGQLLKELQSFYIHTLVQHERNGAHNYLPHITLCSFFQLPDDGITEIIRALHSTVNKLRTEFPDKIKLEHYTSQTFLGLFVDQTHNEILKKISVNFMREIADLQINIEPYLKALHVTLAYQFDVKHYEDFEKLTRNVNADAATTWELRLYSRDMRIKGNEVHKVLYSYSPQLADELELVIGDYVYVNGEELNKTDNNWVKGVSWLTGCSGFFPTTYIERTAESDAWTLHKSFSICPQHLLNLNDEVSKSPSRTIQDLQKELTNSKAIVPSDSVQPEVEERICSPVPTKRKSQTEGSPKESTCYENVNLKSNLPRQLFVVRHGERIDFTYGSWIPLCFDQNGRYSPKDLNMPETVYPRQPSDYQKDSPLTEMGLHQAKLTGAAMYKANVKFSQVFCSPSLRCVQTATTILREMKSSLDINIEPGLFEWLAWYPDIQPIWFKPKELKNFGFPINVTYKALMSVEELYTHKAESSDQYYARSYSITQTLLESRQSGNILFVGHAATLDVCTRRLVRGKIRTAHDLVRVVRKVPYLGVAVAEESSTGWNLVSPPILPLTHSNNSKYDWRCMLDDGNNDKL